jgi:hypothetical protein
MAITEGTRFDPKRFKRADGDEVVTPVPTEVKAPTATEKITTSVKKEPIKFMVAGVVVIALIFIAWKISMRNKK